MSYLTKYTPRGQGRAAAVKTLTPASKPIPGREKDMVLNAAGGYVFKADDWTKLSRFLILGSEGGSFYINERKLTKLNCEAADRCIREDGKRVVDMVVDVSTNDRALKTDPALFVLAMAAAAGGKSPTEKDIEVRKYALNALPKVARTATHLFHWIEFVQGFRGWGRSLRATVANWYAGKRADKLAYQALKYKSRDGWSHTDVFRLAHPVTSDLALSAVFNYIARPDESPLKKGVSEIVEALSKRGKKVDFKLPLTKAGVAKSFEDMDFGTRGLIQIAAAEELVHLEGKGKDSVKQAIRLITEYNLPREAVPTQLQKSPEVWEALLNADMGLGAMLRTLNRMTASGLLTDRSEATKLVRERLRNKELLQKAHIHPLAILIALRQYAAGRGEKGDLSWTAVQKIVDALDEAFYASFEFVEPTGKDILVAVDCSGSMQSSHVMGVPNMTAAEAAAAMALVIAATEPDVELVRFGTSVSKLAITPRMRLNDAMRAVMNSAQGTDLSLPFKYAMSQSKKDKFDAVVSLTDNETWAGYSHPLEALRDLRRKHGQVLAVNCSTVATRNTALDGKTGGVLEVVGFDAAMPNLINEFIKGNV